MKKLIVTTIILCSPMFAYAEKCATSTDAEQIEETREIKTDVPKHLEGATITIRLADGRESTVPAEKFKVVPRLQQFLITKTKQQTTTMCSADKNRLSVLAGKGPKNGLDVDKSQAPNKVSVENEYGGVGGLQYQRLVTDRVSVGAQVQTNESVLLGIGIEF
jgi:hypothetical protein